MSEFPLHTAVREGQLEVITDLLNNGFDINAKDDRQKTPLHLSAMSTDEKIFKVLMDSGSDPNAKDKRDETPLHQAVKTGNLNNLKLLLEAAADSNAKNNKGYTSLHLATESLNLNVIKLLLDSGANVNAKNESNEIPLNFAVKSRSESVVKLLLDSGSDTDHKVYDHDNGVKYHPLHWAVRRGQINIVKFLIEAGANVHVQDHGDTPLHVSLRLKYESISKLLLNAGANINAKGSCGFTSLHLAAEAGSQNAIFKTLIDGGADLDAQNSYRITPLHLAATNGHYNALKLLIEAGSDANKQNSSGHTALTLFSCNLYGKRDSTVIKVTKLLLEHTDVNLVGTDGKNLLVDTLNEKFQRSYYPEPLKRCFYEAVLKHIAKLKLAKIYVDPELLDYVSCSERYCEFFLKCTKELEKAKSTKLHNSWVTFFDLAVDDEFKFVKYAGNEGLMQDCKKTHFKNFPIYWETIKINMENGICARKSYDSSVNVLSKHLPIFNPTHLVIKDTLEALQEEDWKKLSGKKRNRE